MMFPQRQPVLWNHDFGRIDGSAEPQSSRCT